MRVLYLEDDPRDADLTVRTLRKYAPHVELETVSTIQEALARLDRITSDPLDLVFLDVHLRDGDGLSLLQHIRESSLPLAVVLVTGMGDEETAVAALKARADDYVVKHKDYLNRLPITLESALNHYRADAARRTHPLKVLYAEGDLPDIESTRRHFAVHADHIRLEAVSTGPEALLALQPQDGSPRYDVLLMDFRLPELNALEVLRELRVTHQQDVPVVLVCREGDEELARQGLKLGASSYLIKSPGYLYQLPWQLEEAHSRADLRRREAALRASEGRNRAILNAIPDVMFLFNREGTYLDYHTKDPSLLPMPAEQFLGKKVVDVLPPQLAANFIQCFEQVSDKPAILEYKLSVPEGTRVFEASIVGCNGDKILAMVRDITERKEAEESLKKALDEVQQLKDRLHEENVYLKEELQQDQTFGEIVGQSDAIKYVLFKITQFAPTDVTVLIMGETGTGKELVARAIHDASLRKDRSLIKVNCAALSPSLIESELFGHEKGAFTGAGARKLGRFELANGGTIFLDEIGELPSELQVKLLRVIQEGEFERLGGTKTIKVDIRIVAATNKNLKLEIEKGNFRQDLWYRLNVFPITVPPLRQRKDDIPLMVEQFVNRSAKKFGKTIDSVSARTMRSLQEHSWPGNVRELVNVIDRAVINSRGRVLDLVDHFERMPEILPSSAKSLEEVEREHIIRTLENTGWRIEGPYGAAKILGLNPSTLRTRMAKLDIQRPRASFA